MFCLEPIYAHWARREMTFHYYVTDLRYATKLKVELLDDAAFFELVSRSRSVLVDPNLAPLLTPERTAAATVGTSCPSTATRRTSSSSGARLSPRRGAEPDAAPRPLPVRARAAHAVLGSARGPARQARRHRLQRRQAEPLDAVRRAEEEVDAAVDVGDPRRRHPDASLRRRLGHFFDRPSCGSLTTCRSRQGRPRRPLESPGDALHRNAPLPGEQNLLGPVVPRRRRPGDIHRDRRREENRPDCDVRGSDRLWREARLSTAEDVGLRHPGARRRRATLHALRQPWEALMLTAGSTTSSRRSTLSASSRRRATGCPTRRSPTASPRPPPSASTSLPARLGLGQPRNSRTRTSSASDTAASAPPRAIPPAPTTPRSGPSSRSSTPPPAGITLTESSRCSPPPPSAASTSLIPRRTTSPSAASLTTRSPTTPAARDAPPRGRALARPEPRVRGGGDGG